MSSNAVLGPPGVVCRHCEHLIELPDFPAADVLAVCCPACRHTADYPRAAIGMLIGAEALTRQRPRFWRRWMLFLLRAVHHERTEIAD